MSRTSSVSDFPGPEVAEMRFGCPLPALWLPRLLAAVVLVAALLASYRIGTGLSVSGFPARHVVVLLGAAIALWIVRQAGELRTEVRLTVDALVFARGARESRLRLEEIQSLSYDPPFAVQGLWLPAAALIDRDGRRWRLSAMLAGGDRLIGQLLRRTGRHDLEVWAETHHLRRRMGRTVLRQAAGYLVVSVVLAAALVFYFR
jgi:hypothetical protein